MLGLYLQEGDVFLRISDKSTFVVEKVNSKIVYGSSIFENGEIWSTFYIYSDFQKDLASGKFEKK